MVVAKVVSVPEFEGRFNEFKLTGQGVSKSWRRLKGWGCGPRHEQEYEAERRQERGESID